MTRMIVAGLFGLFAGVHPAAAQEILDGTWKLVSSTRTNTATGATVDTFGAGPKGFIMYGKDGRMMVLITRSDRPKAAGVDKLTDEQRNRLFSSMIAYAGTYKFDGQRIEHHIDLSWNEVWGGTLQVRFVKKDGERLIYTTEPSPSPVDGSMGVGTLVWERVK
jgi:hypothetical protein